MNKLTCKQWPRHARRLTRVLTIVLCTSIYVKMSLGRADEQQQQQPQRQQQYGDCGDGDPRKNHWFIAL